MSDAKHKAGTILVVDDDVISRAIIGNLFEAEYEVAEAANGQECLDYLMSDGNHVVALLLDIMMPRVDGIEVLHRLAPTGFLEHVPVFLITAERTSSVMEEAYRLGVMDFIVKPIIPFVVTRRVRSVIELFESRKRLRNTVEDQRARAPRAGPADHRAQRRHDRGALHRHRVSRRRERRPRAADSRFYAPHAHAHLDGGGALCRGYRRHRAPPPSCTTWARSPSPTRSSANRGGSRPRSLRS